MLIRPSNLVSAISGTLGGINFAAGRGAPYVRLAGSRADTRSERQINHRTRLGIVINAWRVLSDNDRQSWRAAAQVYNRTNRLGVPRSYSGFQLYLAYILQHFDQLASFDIPCEQMLTAPNPGTWTFDLPQTDDWEAFPAGVTSSFTLWHKFFIARGNVNYSRRAYKNYNFFLRARAVAPFTVIRTHPSTDPLLYDGQVGEKVSFMLIVSIEEPDGLFLDSYPQFFEATITA
jgi:hypothetical protein